MPSARTAPTGDWDLGVYYRSQRPLNPADVRRLGHHGQVSELGEWGPVVHGGGWLTVDDTHVDVLFRNLDTIDQWHDQTLRGHFEILDQAGYLAGAPAPTPA